jgi:hypothetical protein
LVMLYLNYHQLKRQTLLKTFSLIKNLDNNLPNGLK